MILFAHTDSVFIVS